MAAAVLAAAVAAAEAEDRGLGEATGPAATDGDVEDTKAETVRASPNEPRYYEDSSMDEIRAEDFPSYSQVIARNLARGHEDVQQAILAFTERRAAAPPSDDAVVSNFPPFEFRADNDEIERIVVDLSVQRKDDVFYVAYQWCCCVTPRTATGVVQAPEPPPDWEQHGQECTIRVGAQTVLPNGGGSAADANFAATSGGSRPKSGGGGTEGQGRRRSNPLEADAWLTERREELNRHGVIKWRLENGVPDVGGLGWRTKAGHILKNQTYYTGALPHQHDWDNPTIAGPKSWKEWHGPRLRTDAPLLQRLDRLDVEQAEWEAKKTFVNTVRVQTLDRFNLRKIENEQREVAVSWAPHRRARREMHKMHDSVTAELDAMPVKELKKVLPSKVLQGDRNAIREITKRIQMEETWKMAWKELDKARHDDTRSDFEHRMAYNELLMDLAGQPRIPRDPNRRLPNNCSARLEEMAKPREPPPPGDGDVTKLIDFRGLIHVDNVFALEARFPGYGHERAVQFRKNVSEASKASWPPPPRPETPASPSTGKRRTIGLDASTSVEKKTVPVSSTRLSGILLRETEHIAHFAGHQFQPTHAPPAPDARRSLMQETLVPDPAQLLDEYSPRTDTSSAQRRKVVGHDTSVHKASEHSSASLVDVSPPKRPSVYPVLAPTREADSMQTDTKGRRRSAASADPRRRRKMERDSIVSTGAAVLAGSAPLSARGPIPRGTAGARASSMGGATQVNHQAPHTGTLEARTGTLEANATSVYNDMDNFEANLRTIPTKGNFWMTPRWTGLTEAVGVARDDSDVEDEALLAKPHVQTSNP